MKARLDRSLIFWSGIFVMISIAWLWWDSMLHFSHVYFQRMQFRNTAGLVSVLYRGHASVPMGVGSKSVGRLKLGMHWSNSPLFPSFRFTKGEGMDYTAAFEEAFQQQNYQEAFTAGMTISPKDAWAIQIPHWLIFAGFLVSWEAVLILHLRQMKRRAGQGSV